jgi:hypothetical protein
MYRDYSAKNCAPRRKNISERQLEKIRFALCVVIIGDAVPDSTGPLVTVVRNRYVHGGATDGAALTPLGLALTRRWPGCDAHFQQARGSGQRVTSRDVGITEIVMTCIAFDLDAPGHMATPAWRAELREEKIAAALAAHPGGFFYETRGGGRLVYAIDPLVIETTDDAQAWPLRYGAGGELLRAFGLECDPACCDVGRLFRVSHATREPGGRPEDRLTIGDPHALGVFPLPEITPHVRERSSPREPIATRDSGAPLGSLYDALLAGGAIVAAREDGSFTVRCPRDALHSVGRVGDGSTVLYPNKSWMGGPGFLLCRHSSCTHIRTAREWRRELQRSRRPAAAEVVRHSTEAA